MVCGSLGLRLKQCISIRELLGRPHWEAIRKFMCRDGVQLFHTNSASWENSPQETASASTQPQEGLLRDYCAHVVGRFFLETSINCRHHAASATTPASLPFAFGQAVTKLLPCKAHGLCLSGVPYSISLLALTSAVCQKTFTSRDFPAQPKSFFLMTEVFS